MSPPARDFRLVCSTAVNQKSSASRAVTMVFLFAYTLLVPAIAVARPDGPGQRAGEISRLIPSVKIMHGAEILPASEKSPIYWDDLVNTLSGGRARMLLEDGSTLNVGSDSNVRVMKHDAVTQQTELALGVGKMRTQAQKIARSTGKFEVRTPVGVAGVVGTDFFVSYHKKAMSVIVFEGKVKLCNLAGKCVIITAGKTSTVCDCSLGGPTEPEEVSEKKTAEAIRSTEVEPVLNAKHMENVVIGTISTSTSCTGSQDSHEGTAVRSGELLSVKPGSALDVCIGALGLQLLDGSTAYVYKTSYGAVVELIRGTIIYNATSVQKENVTIVASDVRITPVLCKRGTGTVTVDDPCHLTISSQSGKLFVVSGAQSHLVEDGQSYLFQPDHYVIARRALSPDAKNYHDGHHHRSCSVGRPFGPTLGNVLPDNGPGSLIGIPEPSSILLLGIGMLGLLVLKLKFLNA